MDCAGYEKELVRLLSGEVGEARRVSVLEGLRRHAEGCASCTGDDALLDWAADRKGPLDPDEDPGGAYWESFEARLGRRLDAQATPERTRSVSRLSWLALAATLTVALIGAALIVNSRRQPPQQASVEPAASPSTTPAPVLQPAGELDEESQRLLADATEAQEHFDRQLEESGVNEVEGDTGSLEALEQDAGMVAQTMAQTAGWMPDVSELDDAAQTEMLRWLEERI